MAGEQGVKEGRGGSMRESRGSRAATTGRHDDGGRDLGLGENEARGKRRGVFRGRRDSALGRHELRHGPLSLGPRSAHRDRQDRTCH